VLDSFMRAKLGRARAHRSDGWLMLSWSGARCTDSKVVVAGLRHLRLGLRELGAAVGGRDAGATLRLGPRSPAGPPDRLLLRPLL